MTEPLKPCPFCGGRARIVIGEECAYVQCEDMKMHRALWLDGDNAVADEVAEQWNRREERNPPFPEWCVPKTIGVIEDAAEVQVGVLTEALEACVASLERANTAEGVCCCGDSMDRHPNPMNCGHSPVDIGHYYAGQALEAARAALATVTPPADTTEGRT